MQIWFPKFFESDLKRSIAFPWWELADPSLEARRVQRLASANIIDEEPYVGLGGEALWSYYGYHGYKHASLE